MPSIIPSADSSLHVSALNHSSGFGATVEGIDLNALGQDEFAALERALYTHKLLVIKNQAGLQPQSQLALVARFDPAAQQVHGHGNVTDANKVLKTGKKSIVGANPGVPSCDQVRMLGRATLPVGHFGATEEITLKSGSHVGFHKHALTQEEIDAGQTRFQRWHFDAALYKTHPPRVTSLWSMVLPKGPDLTARWDDGSDTTMQVAPGRTAFIDMAQCYAQLSDEDKAWVDHSEVEYAPSPYQVIAPARAYSNGFGMYSDGLETPYDDLPSNDPALVMRYPLVWTNPFTAEKSLQVHHLVAAKLFLRTSPAGPATVVADLAQVRDTLYTLQRPFLRPENILVAPVEEGDLVLWYNRGLRHSALEYPAEGYGPRVCHQVHIAGSDDPGRPELVQEGAK